MSIDRTNTIKKLPELLSPAGNFEKMRAAILYGADAVYAGTPDMCLRAQSKFSMEELKEGIDYTAYISKNVKPIHIFK